MPALVWDEVGTRFFEVGVDRGVLYLEDAPGVVWNGLISINEGKEGGESTPIYFDGIKFSDSLVPGDFSATLSAYTYPDEFLECEGVLDVGNGLFADNQQPSRFGLSYRTKVGDDVDGVDQGYKIHILYNVTAVPSQKSYESIGSETNPIVFEWNLTAIPEEIEGYRPTAHLILDTRSMDSLLIADVEIMLYGDDTNDPTLPSISTLVGL